MVIFAHRGSSARAAENTLASFAMAIEQGADGIELDVQLVEGRLIVFHDHRLERTTNGVGMVASASLDLLRSLDAGKGQRIPLLEEALDLIDRQAVVNIELKGRGTAGATAAILNEAIANKGWKADDFLVSSFIHPELASFRRMAPHIPIGALLMGIPLDICDLCRQLSVYAIHASIEFIEQKMIDDVHHAGAKVFVYTVNFADEALWLRRLGVDGVFTDYPDRIREALKACDEV